MFTFTFVSETRFLYVQLFLTFRFFEPSVLVLTVRSKAEQLLTPGCSSPLPLRPNSKASHDYERLKSQCMRAMADLQSLQNQHTKTLKRCEEAAKEADFYQ